MIYLSSYGAVFLRPIDTQYIQQCLEQGAEQMFTKQYESDTIAHTQRVNSILRVNIYLTPCICVYCMLCVLCCVQFELFLSFDCW